MLRRLRQSFRFSSQFLIAAVIFLAGLLAGAAVTTYVTLPWSPTVAVVNGERITAAQWHEAMQTLTGEEALDELINYALIRQEAQRRGVSLAAAAVDEHVAEIRDAFGTRGEFAAQLAAAGMTEALFRQRLYHQRLMEQVVADRVTVTEEEKAAYFARYRDFYQDRHEVELRHIQVESERAARQLLGELQNDASFAALAQLHSEDDASRADGGYLGPLIEEELDLLLGRDVAREAFALAEGELAGPIEGDFGFHVIEVLARHAAEPVLFADVEAEIEQEVMRQKGGDPVLVLERLKLGAKIQLRHQ